MGVDTGCLGYQAWSWRTVHLLILARNIIHLGRLIRFPLAAPARQRGAIPAPSRGLANESEATTVLQVHLPKNRFLPEENPQIRANKITS